MNLLKLTFILAFTFCLSNLIIAQDNLEGISIEDVDSTKTLFSSFKLKTLGLYVSPEASYSQYASSYTNLNGGSLMFLFNSKWALGVNAQSSQRNSFTPTLLNANKALEMNIQNAGIRIEYITNPQKVFHFSLPLALGVGRASVDSVNAVQVDYDNRGRNHRNGFKGSSANSSYFGYIQPGVNLEVNVFKYGKIFFGGSYRLATNINSDALAPYKLTTAQVSGLNISVGAKLGLFNYKLARATKE
jgi:hypothetical protein